ncbi:hypothetical protein [Streptomyces bluensis]|uniref:hypothetical protein n=1 Tax=Streptomyces bluensis TaxID=33897 RepID=UPI001679E54D|nr:hypothetical protein [Streptomyces bluensis]GGZ90400.1 hypothetical protein GCM10010344_67480 [Streptomyces bluensis]
MKDSDAGLPFDRLGTQADGGPADAHAPLHKCAFDHPETRVAWEQARRKVKRGRWIWHFLYALSWVAYFVLFGNLSSENAKERAAGGIVLVSFVYLTLLYLRRDVMASLKRIRRVLEQHPWQLISAAHRPDGVKDVMGVPVQLRYHEGEELTGLMSARNPLRRRHWPEELEHGAWYAGQVWQAGGARTRGFGVLAVPGGGELMEVSRETAVRR